MQFNRFRPFIPALFVALAGYYTLPLLLNITHWGVRDWDLFLTIAAVPAGSVLDYGQFPFWNPYLGGGNILFHHPEVSVLSPFFLLYLAFGAVVGLKLQVLVCYFLGMYGTYWLARSLDLSRMAGVMVAVAYFGSVHFALHIAEGHMPFTHFCFLPWFLAGVLKPESGYRWLLISIAALTLMLLGNGAAVPFLYTMFFSGLAVLLLTLSDKRWLRLQRFLIATGFGVGLAGIKMLPMIVYLIRNVWQVDTNEVIPLTALGDIFFGLSHSLFVSHFDGQKWAWHEYGAYISPFLVLLALGALILQRGRARVWLLLAVFFFLLGLGNFAGWSPWALLTQLPGFSSLRCTGRAFQFVILSLAVMGGLGFDLFRARVVSPNRQDWVRKGLFLAYGVVIATNLALSWPILNEAVGDPPRQVRRYDRFKHVVDEGRRAYPNYLANRGSLVTPWLSAYRPSRGLVTADNRVLPEFIAAGIADVSYREYTPNRIEYHFDASLPGRMIIGMGYDHGWQASDGRGLRQENGLISFEFARGHHELVLEYRTPYFGSGLALSVLSLLGLGGLTWYRRTRPPQPDK